MTMTELIRLHYPILDFKKPVQQVVAMGFFDGVHRGHQAVLARAKAEAEKQGVPLAVLTYDPHPIVAFQTLKKPLAKKKSIMSQLGVDRVYVMQFTSKLAKLGGQQFVDEVVMQLNPVTVVAGFDHLYGAAGTDSDMLHLATYATNRFDVITVSEFDDYNQKVSSSTIRSMLDQGNVDGAAQQLGRVPSTSGIVVHGEARGR